MVILRKFLFLLNRPRRILRSSHWRCSISKGVLRNFAKFTGKYLFQSLLFNKVAGLRKTKNCRKTPEACNSIKKEALAQVLSSEFSEISKNTFSYRILRWLLLNLPITIKFLKWNIVSLLLHLKSIRVPNGFVTLNQYNQYQTLFIYCITTKTALVIFSENCKDTTEITKNCSCARLM